MLKIANKTSCIIPNVCCDKVVIVLCAEYFSLNIKELSCTMHEFYILYTSNSLYTCEVKVTDIDFGQSVVWAYFSSKYR